MEKQEMADPAPSTSAAPTTEAPNQADPAPSTSEAPTTEAPTQPSFMLPPLLNPSTKTVVLDLDLTLIHTTDDNPPSRYDFAVNALLGGVSTNFYISKRPGLDELLEFLGKKFEVVVFTAGAEEYASPILDVLDPNRVISHRLYRDSCKIVDGSCVKDLSVLGRDLKKVVIVDDNKRSFMLQPENGIHMRPFEDNLLDTELRRLRVFFTVYQDCEDFPEAISEFAPFGWRNPLY